METIRDKLVMALDLLGEAGALADPLLVNEERTVALAPTPDERVVQTLAAVSRETWEAYRAVRAAIAATHQHEKITNS
jgi:hypothetical protein